MQRRISTGRWWPGWRAAAALGAPVVLLVAGITLWRYGYYGEWLPNTYYAKYVRPWYEMGLRYLAVAAVETGLYLLPLAGLAFVKGWRTRRDLTYALPLLCIGLHMVETARIGGDHYEYRLLDVYWSLLAVPAAVGVVYLGKWLAAVARPSLASSRFAMPPRLVCSCFSCPSYSTLAPSKPPFRSGTHDSTSKTGLFISNLTRKACGG